MNCELKDLRATTAEQSRDRLLSVLNGEPGPARDIVLFNAGAAIYTADIAPSLADGVTMAREALDSGKARQKLNELIAMTQQFGH
jgi:anthranilate phosphoribosyltransferase